MSRSDEEALRKIALAEKTTLIRSLIDACASVHNAAQLIPDFGVTLEEEQCLQAINNHLLGLISAFRNLERSSRRGVPDVGTANSTGNKPG